MKYILFKRVPVLKEKKQKPIDPFYNMFCMRPPDGEEWKDGDSEKEEDGTVKTELKFLAEVENPEQVAQIVRKSPLEKYVLFSGEIRDIQIAMPVFVDGKSLDSLKHEWD